jgi:DinB superfamily
VNGGTKQEGNGEREPNYVDDLIGTIGSTAQRLSTVADLAAARRPRPGKWSAKEIIGHLVDSAANNHQRFVRAAWQDDLVFPGYDQNEWVRVQEYQTTPWLPLVSLWSGYNLHLAHVMLAVPETVRLRLDARHNFDEIAWQTVARDEPTSLDYLMQDYVGHMQHHLRQIDAILGRQDVT